VKTDHQTLDNNYLNERGSCPEQNPLLIGEQIWKPLAEELRFVMARLEGELRPTGRILLKKLYQPEGNEYLIPPGLVLLSGHLFSRKTQYMPAVYMGLIYLGNLFHNRAGIKDKNQQLYILTGDFLFGHLLQLISDLKHLFLLERFADLITTMNEGFSAAEEYSIRDNPTKEELIELLRMQYGAFYGECCALGGLFAGCNSKEQSLLKEFGTALGIAYGYKKTCCTSLHSHQLLIEGLQALSQLPVSQDKTVLVNFAQYIIDE
jgi:hypothetical protein